MDLTLTQVRGKEKVKQIMEKAELLQEHSDKSCMPNHVPLEDFPYNKHDVLQSRHSPLIVVELKDIINFDAFMGLLTVQEQTQLMKYASSVDVAGVPESLNCMFNSVQFEEALTNFQQLLSEGMFDFYGFGLSPQAQQILQKLILTDLTNSKWIERYSQPQNRNKRRRLFDSAKAIQNRETAKIKGSNLPSSVFSKSGAYVAPKNSSGWQPSQGIAGSENSMNSPANLQKTGTAITCPLTPVWANSGTTGIYHEITDSGCTSKELFEFDIGATNGSCFSPSSLFASPLQRSSSTVLDSTSTLSDEGFEQDLLLDVPSNMSFQQAELLHTPVWKCKNSKDSMPDGNNLENSNSRESMPNNLWGSEDSLEWSGLFWNSSCVGSGQTLPNGTVLYPEKMLP